MVAAILLEASSLLSIEARPIPSSTTPTCIYHTPLLPSTNLPSYHVPRPFPMTGENGFLVYGHFRVVFPLAFISLSPFSELHCPPLPLLLVLYTHFFALACLLAPSPAFFGGSHCCTLLMYDGVCMLFPFFFGFLIHNFLFSFFFGLLG